ncbi:CBS domain-containing protein [Deferrisoma sp.]
MDLITTHINADFDSLGAMVAAKRLYPDAVLAFSGSQERSLRQFLLESALYAMDLRKARHVDLSAVRRLVLVDVSQPDRIGRFAELLDRPDVEVHVYDHHPDPDRAIRARVRHIEPVGAATTLLVEILRERRLPITPEEATAMLLGIYEDTGGLVFATTTPRDLEAAAYLLGQGGDLNIVSSFLTPDLSLEQVRLLEALLRNQTVHRIYGVDVTVTEASADHYVGDVAFLIHKVRDMENLDVVVAAVRLGDQVQVVARSRIPTQVDVGALARALGGGGHPEAASASIRDETLVQVRERILGLLPKIVRPPVTARDIASAPVKFVRSGAKLREVQEALNRYHLNAMPVLDDGGRVVGVVTRMIVERAIRHGLAEAPVGDYMTTEVETVGPDAPLDEVRRLVVRENHRLVPVVERGALAGVITRTDLLRSLTAEFGPVDSGARDPQERDVSRMLRERLSPDVLDRLREFGALARERGMEAYLVGGGVRDLLLRRPVEDLDLVVEGDGVALAEEAAERWGARVRPHRPFGTAKLVCPDGVRLDVATARTEYYARPGALPTVEWSSLKLDLYRRDFSINTLAVRLSPARFGEVVDFFGGLRDLKEGTIRVLHNLSFVEDPTRILRALRFQRRFGFRLGRQTEKLLRTAVREGFLTEARGKRMFQEWVALLSEGDGAESLALAEEHGVLEALLPGVRYDPRLEALVERVRGVLTWFRLLYRESELDDWRVYQLALLDPLKEGQAEQWVLAMGIAQGEGRRLLAAREAAYRALGELRKALDQGSGAVPDSRVHAILHPCGDEARLFMMAKTEDDRKRRLISRYYTRLADVRPVLQGRDLQRMGIPPGPVYREILDGLLRARLDGEVRTRADEEAWVRRRWTDRGPPSGVDAGRRGR